MNFVKYITGLALGLALVACGGGGGNSGTSGSTTSSTTTAVVSSIPKLTLDLLDDTGATTDSISATGATTLKASLKNADGSVIGAKIVSVTADAAQVKFPDGSSARTNTSTGIALLKVGRASISAVGAGNLTVTYSYTSVSAAGSTPGTISETIAYQLSPLNVTLTALSLGTTALPAYGNRPVSVQAKINGVVATDAAVQVTFSASCGTITPTSATTDATGTASATYSSSLATCSGTNVLIGATAVGAAAPVSGTVVVSPSVATNVQFDSATPSLIYLKDSVGTTQSQVVFKVVDSTGAPLQNQKLRLTLSNVATGVTLNTLGNTASVDLTTDDVGKVSVAVFSGTVPTSLNVKATLLNPAGAETSIFSNSNLLTVASGRPTQRSLSLALGKLSIEGAGTDLRTTSVTLSMADRQGNPVPPGTQVNFVTEAGVLLPAVCFVPPVTPATPSSPAVPTSSCSVNIYSSGTRTANGRVSILAYVAGEEDFVDNNGDNIFNAGDTFTDLGRAYRDDNDQATTGANGAYSTGEFQVPRVGAAACSATTGTCLGDGVWGDVDVRKQATVIFASGDATIIGTFSSAVQSLPAVLDDVTTPLVNEALPAVFVVPVLSLTIRDTNLLSANSMPTGSTVDVSTSDNSVSAPALSRTDTTLIGTCSILGSNSFTIGNTLDPFGVGLSLKNCVSNDTVTVLVISPAGIRTSRTFTIP